MPRFLFVGGTAVTMEDVPVSRALPRLRSRRVVAQFDGPRSGQISNTAHGKSERPTEKPAIITKADMAMAAVIFERLGPRK